VITSRLNYSLGQIAKAAFDEIPASDHDTAWQAAGQAVMDTASAKELLQALIRVATDNKTQQPQLGREWAVLLTETEKLMAWYRYKIEV